MSYFDLLNRLCNNLDQAQCLSQCSSIIRTVLSDKENTDSSRGALVDDICRYFAQVLHHNGLRPARDDAFISSLPTIAEIPGAKELLLDHSPGHSKAVERAKARLAGYDKRIRTAWGDGAYHILPLALYDPARPLSKHFLDLLCKIAEATDRATGTQAILDALQKTDSKHVSLKHLRVAVAPFVPANGYPRGRRQSLYLSTTYANFDNVSCQILTQEPRKYLTSICLPACRYPKLSPQDLLR